MTCLKLEHVAYIEDEPDIRAVARLALTLVGGLAVDLFASGEAALECYATGEARPQLVILDVMMPEMDGPTTMRRLRALPGFATLPFMFMTAKIQKREIEQLMAHGAVDVLPKPFDPMTLAQEIRERWARLCPHVSASTP